MAFDRKAVEAVLKEARAAVEGASVPAELREVAFAKAVDLLSGHVAATTTTSQDADARSGEGDSTKKFTGDERLAKIAQKTGADVAKLPYVYDIDDDGVTMLIKRSQLSKSDAGATRELTLLFAAARQASGIDTLTKVELIRERVEDMGVYDSKNFSTDLKKISGITIKGTGNARELKVTQHAFEEAGKLIARITGGDS
jgi:hypothetical protein